MNKLKYCKKLFTLASIACLGMAALLSPAATLKAEASTPSIAQPQYDETEWILKTEDGKLYKRLYNKTRGYWITNWIYVCDL